MTYLTIAAPAEYEIEIKRSRFVCALGRVGDEAAARDYREAVRKRRWDARHNCTAYVVGWPQPAERSSDDGEPAGTAGVPMLEVLRRRGLTDVVAVVSRYFGGVLLGAGGLVRAYSGAVAGAVDTAGLVARERVTVVEVAAGHASAGAVQHALRAAGHPVRDVRYAADGVRIEVVVPDEPAFTAWLAEATAGAATAAAIGTDWVDRPVS